ncbi:putative toxin-antitoxin system toxin component, PIN family [Halobellus rubicundus]|uniref:Toxin-antitoxin system toxin component, PIN family n=1 Tax=Halobellus rubicundus TaxID=2996466 RepID=A0ABD5MCV2_9EURY
MGTRVVLDTNILISALGWNGKPEQCLQLVFEDEIEAYATQEMIDEFSQVLEYDKFPFTEKEKQSFLEIVVAEFEFADSKINVSASVDSADDIFLECAAAVDADYLISGDSDLLQLNEFRDIPILTAEEFLGEHATD